MDLNNRKLEIAFAAAVALFIGASGWMLSGRSQAISDSFEELVYEMPRPKSLLASLFELGDRDISREYKNPYAKNKKSKANEKAKMDTPKQAQKAPAKPAVAKKSAVAPQAVSKKKSFKVDVVGAGPSPKNNSPREKFAAPMAGSYGSGRENSPQNEVKNQNEMAAGQWRSLLLASPTEENLAKLLTAYSKKELESSELLEIVNDLLSDKRTDVQNLGIIALHVNYSVQAFSLATQHYEQIDETLKSKMDSYLKNYSSSGRLDVLASALTSHDSATVTLATRVLVQGYKEAKAGGKTGTATDPRLVRVSGPFGVVSSYNQFIPILKRLSAATDQEVASAASAALSQMQTAVASL